jgi:hypothetical protein
LNLHTIQLCVLYQLDRHFAPNDRRAKFHVFRVLLYSSTVPKQHHLSLSVRQRRINPSHFLSRSANTYRHVTSNSLF